MARPASIPAAPLARLAADMHLMPVRARRRLAERCLAALEKLPASGTVAIGTVMRTLTGTEARDYGSGPLDAAVARRGLLALALRASESAPLPPVAGDRSEEEVASACSVTTRTVRRWRAEWLPAAWRDGGGSGHEQRTPVLAITAEGWGHLRARGLVRAPSRTMRISAEERARIRESAASLARAGVAARHAAPALARLHGRSADAVRRALGRRPVARTPTADAHRAWRLWLRGVPLRAVAERLRLAPASARALILASRAAWVRGSVPRMAPALPLSVDDLAAIRSEAGIGTGLPAHPWAAPSSSGPERSPRRSPRRMELVRRLLVTARQCASARPLAGRIDGAETMLRWATLLLRAEAQPVCASLVRRARRELGLPPESMPPAMRTRFHSRLGAIVVEALLHELSQPEGLPADRRAALAFDRLLRQLSAHTKGTARLAHPAAPPDVLRDRFPWDLRLDSRALRRFERGDVDGLLVAGHRAADVIAMRLGLRGGAPLSAGELPWVQPASLGTALREWESVSTARR